MKIIAGDTGSQYYAHPGALSSCASSALSARINGSWKDAGDSVIDWTDFDEQTVECVLNYLYTRDYDAPQLASVSMSQPSQEDKRLVDPKEGKLTIASIG